MFKPNIIASILSSFFFVTEQILRTVEAYPVTVIQGETGSGKTTQVAQYILDDCARKGQYCNIIVTQPRRIAAISICRRVCNERGWQLGKICGYQVIWKSFLIHSCNWRKLQLVLSALMGHIAWIMVMSCQWSITLAFLYLQVGLDNQSSEDTRLLYCTTGILLNRLITRKNMHEYTHVILDEVHERDQESDFSLLVVKKFLRTNSSATKVRESYWIGLFK